MSASVDQELAELRRANAELRRAYAELQRANRLMPDMPETLYALGKAASLQGDSKSAETAWLKLIQMESKSSLAAQAHFALAGLYRKQGKTSDAEREMREFQSLQGSSDSANTSPR